MATANKTTSKRGRKPKTMSNKKTTTDNKVETKKNVTTQVDPEDRLLAALKDIDEIGLENISEDAKKKHKKVFDLLEEKQTSGSQEWLEEQIEQLTTSNQKLLKENKELKENYDKIFKDYEKLKNNRATEPALKSSNSSQVEKSVQQLYDEFKFAMSRNWTTAKLPKLMQKFKQHFPFVK